MMDTILYAAPQAERSGRTVTLRAR